LAHIGAVHNRHDSQFTGFIQCEAIFNKDVGVRDETAIVTLAHEGKVGDENVRCFDLGQNGVDGSEGRVAPVSLSPASRIRNTTVLRSSCVGDSEGSHLRAWCTKRLWLEIRYAGSDARV